jgi:hypothetical protein
VNIIQTIPDTTGYNATVAVGVVALLVLAAILIYITIWGLREDHRKRPQPSKPISRQAQRHWELGHDMCLADEDDCPLCAEDHPL